MGSVHILVFSPCTTIAQSVGLDPDAFTDHVASVRIMGGAMDAPGNVSPLAESNFYQDGLAANFVLSAFQEYGRGDKVALLPLDVTLQVAFTQQQLESHLVNSVGQWWVREVIPHYLKMYANISQGMPIHDAHPLVHLLRPELYRGIRARRVGVVTHGMARGMLYRDARDFAAPGDHEDDGDGVSRCQSRSGDSVLGDGHRPRLPLIVTDVDVTAFKSFLLGTLATL